MFTIENVNGNIKFPTSYDEFTPEVLKALTEPIILGDNKVAIALVKACKLSAYAFRVSNDGKLIGKSSNEISVIPFIAKVNETSRFKIGDTAVIAVSEIERANHINSVIEPAEITLLSTFANCPEFRNDVINKKAILDDAGNEIDEVLVLSMIVVPEFNIAASIPLHYNVKSPFGE